MSRESVSRKAVALGARAGVPSRLAAIAENFSELSKARLTMLVLATTLVGYIVGHQGALDFIGLAAALAGTAMCAAGASALNQWWERDLDAKMKRTRGRPLPSGAVLPGDVFALGLALVVIGVTVLAVFTNYRAAFLAFATAAIYVVVYTPLKTMTTLNTQIGAVPGALPPLVGWVAARETYNLEGCLLFAVLWFWQMPHFLAIAWMYREDYAAAGFRMLSGRDAGGRHTAWQALLYTVCLVAVTALPAVVGFNSSIYLAGALALGAGFAWFAASFLADRSRNRARALFLASVAYLPLLLALLVFTRKG